MSRMDRCRCTLMGCAALVVAGWAPAARADMGPDFSGPNGAHIDVTYQGKRLDDKFEAALLQYVPPGQPVPNVPFYNGTRPKAIQVPIDDADGGHWTYCFYGRSGGVGYASAVDFRQADVDASEKKADRVRLAVVLPDDDTVYLTEPAGAHPKGRSRYVADLAPDGTGTLTLLPQESSDRGFDWDAYSVYGVWIAFFVALMLTLTIEMVVVLVWMAVLRRSPGRVLLTALLGNCLSLPLVWVATIAAHRHLEFEGIAAVFLLAEAVAVVLEACLYAWLGRLSVGTAAALSVTANLASLIFGLCAAVPSW